jgi:hypothetical protein
MAVIRMSIVPEKRIVVAEVSSEEFIRGLKKIKTCEAAEKEKGWTFPNDEKNFKEILKVLEKGLVRLDLVELYDEMMKRLCSLDTMNCYFHVNEQLILFFKKPAYAIQKEDVSAFLEYVHANEPLFRRYWERIDEALKFYCKEVLQIDCFG